MPIYCVNTLICFIKCEHFYKNLRLKSKKTNLKFLIYILKEIFFVLLFVIWGLIVKYFSFSFNESITDFFGSYFLKNL